MRNAHIIGLSIGLAALSSLGTALYLHGDAKRPPVASTAAPPLSNGALVDLEVKTVSTAADLCLSEIRTTGISGGFCSSFQQTLSAVFKGSSQTYINYHLANGDITENGNAQAILTGMKRINEAQNAMLEVAEHNLRN